MVLVLLAMAGLAGLGGITALSVRGSIDAAGHDRFKAIALYAAESGAAAAIDYLRAQSVEGVEWSTLVTPANDSPFVPVGIAGNNILPGEDDNPFSDDMQAYFVAEILNNQGDTGFIDGEDTDSRLIIRATGHGPDGATARIELEVRSNFQSGSVAHCPGYGQRGLAQDNAGRNDCLEIINSDETATYTPGDN